MAHGQWAVDIRSLDRGDTIFQINAGKLMMPASNMKILTLAAAAESLGWDARFETSLETSADIVDGVLRGDLYVRGSGDPSINTRNNRGDAVFDEWAAALKAAGIAVISGRVVGDDQAFDDRGVGAGWSWDYLQYGYAAPVGALQFNENVAQITIAPGAAAGDPAIVRISAGSGYTLVNRASTGAVGTEESIDYERRLEEPVLEVIGSIPAGREAITRNVAVINPTVFFARSLRDALIARGIRVDGEAVDYDDIAAELAPGTPARRALVTTQSPPLSETATVLMKVSQNLYAESFLKSVGAKAGGIGTTAAGRRVALQTFESWGIPQRSFVMSDGSGLSRYNYVTASGITSILEHLYKDPKHRDAFIATLPIAGKDGTIRTRMRRSRAEGNAVAKTGSIANVRSLSGFVRTRDGEMLVFSILANDFLIPSATVDWIVDLAVEILANSTARES